MLPSVILGEIVMGLLKRHPIITGIAIFFAVLIGVNLLLGPATCNDGWHSSSIGKQGACSHHGGVARWKGSVAAILALIAGGSAGWNLYQKAEAEEATRRAEAGAQASTVRQAYAVEQAKRYDESGGLEGAPACNLCGALMMKRRAKRGKRSGSLFWGCSNYPRCKGTKSIEGKGAS
jgi:hypothetical protein